MNSKNLLITLAMLFFTFALSAQSKVENKEQKERAAIKLEAQKTGSQKSAPEDIGIVSDHGGSVIGGSEGKLVLVDGTSELRMDDADLQRYNSSTDEYSGTLYLNDQGGDVRIAGSNLIVPQTGQINLNDDIGVSGGVTIGTLSGTPLNGAIQYFTDDFMGYKDGVWTSLTGPWSSSANGISYNNVEIHDSSTSGRIDFTSSSHVYQLSPEDATFTVRDDNTYKFGYYGPDEFGPTASNNMTLGSSTYRWMEIWSNNPLNTTSDERLKKNIKPTTYGLKDVLKLQPVEYQWKKGHDRVMIGLIAQDVENIIPAIVRHDIMTEEQIQAIESGGGGRIVAEESKDIYSMSYSQLIPVLINSIKELNAEIEKLKTQIKE